MVPEEDRSGSEYVNQVLPDFSEVHSEKTKQSPLECKEDNAAITLA